MSASSRAAASAAPGNDPLAYGLLMLAPLFWAGNAVVGRYIHEQIPPVSLSLFRWLTALAVLLPAALPTLRSQLPLLLRQWKLITLLGLSGVTLFQTLLYTALQSTAAINTVFIQTMTPAVIVVFARLLLHERVSAAQVAGIVVSFTGTMVLIARGSPSALLSLQLNRGDLWMLAAVPAWALYSVLLRRLPAGLRHSALLSAIILCGLVMLSPLYVWERVHGAVAEFDRATVLSILYVGLFPSVVAYSCWNRGIARVGANRAALFMHLMPVFGAVLAVAFLGEHLHLFHFVGAALIFSGIWLTSVARAGHPHDAAH